MSSEPRRRLALVTLLVRDYDEAIAWFQSRLGFRLVEDGDLGDGKRWVVIAAPGCDTGLLLARAVGPEQLGRVGDQAAGRVFLFLHTDDFERDHRAMLAQDVEFYEKPRHESYGTVAVFRDLYGNFWDLIEPR
ncbi:VOC family protein [Consotaella aegiceratis]|uniref:VOC family protein n=1 Tax=Consotaella aegiceratis TaxID=3097961 RepID=UPI002F3EDE33